MTHQPVCLDMPLRAFRHKPFHTLKKVFRGCKFKKIFGFDKEKFKEKEIELTNWNKNASCQSNFNTPAPIAIIYKSELDYISRCILDCTNIETGGQLFGFWTAEGVPVVLYAIGPGPHANHQSAFFNLLPLPTARTTNQACMTRVVSRP